MDLGGMDKMPDQKPLMVVFLEGDTIFLLLMEPGFDLHLAFSL